MNDLAWIPDCSLRAMGKGLQIVVLNRLLPTLQIVGHGLLFAAATIAIAFELILTVCIYFRECALPPNAIIATLFFIGNAAIAFLLCHLAIDTKRR